MVNPRFEVNDTVLALDKANIYEAKILKIQSLDENPKYFIHYNGWSKKYDCWIEEAHLAKKGIEKELDKLKELAKCFFKIGSKSVTQAQQEFISNLQKDRKTKNTTTTAAASSSSSTSLQKGTISTRKRKAEEISNDTPSEVGGESSEVTESVSGGAVTSGGVGNENSSSQAIIDGGVKEEEEKPVEERGKATIKKRRKAEEAQQLEVIKKRKNLRQSDLIDDEDPEIASIIPMPAGLKRGLVDDWKAITKTPQKLVSLPVNANVTVEAIINAFLAFNTKSKEYSEYNAFFNGLKIQFNKALPSLLLFRQEREQFDKINEHCLDENYAQIYGAHHLIRFYVRLPRLLNNIVMPANDLNRIMSNLIDLLKFLEKNFNQYVTTSDYILANEAVLRAEKEFSSEKGL